MEVQCLLLYQWQFKYLYYTLMNKTFLAAPYSRQHTTLLPVGLSVHALTV